MRHVSRVVLACLLTTAAGFAGTSFAATASSSAAVLVGDQTVQSAPGTASSGSADAFAFSAGANGTASSISVYLDGQNRATTLRAGLYTDSGGHPGTLLAAGSTSSPNAEAWNTLSIPQTSVSAQSTYWIAVLGTGGTLYFREGTGGSCLSENSSSQRLRSLPSQWRQGTAGIACPISAYASDSTSGGGSGGVVPAEGRRPPRQQRSLTLRPLRRRDRPCTSTPRHPAVRQHRARTVGRTCHRPGACMRLGPEPDSISASRWSARST